MARAERAALVALAFGATLAMGLEASARTETLRWTHSDPGSVRGFVVHWGNVSRTYTSSLDVGVPASQNGAFAATINVPDSADVYLAVTAYDDQLDSFYSNEQCRGPFGACGSTDGGGTGGGTGGSGGGTGTTASAAVVGFRLWDASNSGEDVLIDSSFVSGESIQLANHSCVAIEVMGNAYLATPGGPGSVMYSFDGSTPSCASAGTGYENEPPFAWEKDGGTNRFGCADSLTQPGTHRLTVTPFDGDTCTGTAGTAVSLTFDVVADPGSGGSGQTLSAPGQPFLVSP